MSHTKGSWELSTCNADGVIVTSNTGRIIHDYRGVGFSSAPQYFKDEEIANAQLIAAAPDLLEACQYFLSRFKDIRCMAGWSQDGHWIGPTLYHIEDKIQSAISKAEGQ